MKLARKSEVSEKVNSHLGEIVTVVGLSAILLVLLVIAVSLTVVICRRRIRKLKERQDGVRQGVVRLGPPQGNIYQEVEELYLKPRSMAAQPENRFIEAPKPAMLRVNLEQNDITAKQKQLLVR